MRTISRTHHTLHRDGNIRRRSGGDGSNSPARGARWGTEYCETHIDAHFGVYRGQKSRATGAVTTKFVGLVPPEHKNAGLLYESYQVEKLRKWAPVRTYYGDLGEKGERGSRWRLKLQLLTRHGIEDEEAFKPQPFSLIITISDPRRGHEFTTRWRKSSEIASRHKILTFGRRRGFAQSNKR